MEKILEIINNNAKDCKEELSLINKRLTDLPQEIARLTHLVNLSLSYNAFVQIPSVVFQLRGLEVIYLSNNQLSNLPPEIAQLQRLESLFLYNNGLESLPDEIGQLEILTILELDGNKLKSIPSSIGNLNNLRRLNLNKNQLTELPIEIAKLEHLLELRVYANPMAEFLRRIFPEKSETDIVGTSNKDKCLSPEELKGLFTFLDPNKVEPEKVELPIVRANLMPVQRHAFEHRISFVLLSEETDELIISDNKGMIYKYHILTHNVTVSAKVDENRIYGMILCQGVLWCCAEGIISMWKTQDLRPIHKNTVHSGKLIKCIIPVEINGKATVWSCSPPTSEILVWHATRPPKKSLKRSIGCMILKFVTCLLYHNKNVWAGGDQLLALFNAETYEQMTSISMESYGLLTTMVSVNSTIWLAASTDIFVLNEDNSNLIQIPKSHDSKVFSMCFIPTSGIVLSGSFDKSVNLWNSAYLEIIGSTHEHNDTVRAIVFSHKHNLVCTGSFDKSIRLWRLYTSSS